MENSVGENMKEILRETSPELEPGFNGETVRETSPNIETGFNGEVGDGAINFPSRMLGRDIMSIVMKRRIGGGATAGEEPICKKARMETKSEESVSTEQNKADKCSDESTEVDKLEQEIDENSTELSEAEKGPTETCLDGYVPEIIGDENDVHGKNNDLIDDSEGVENSFKEINANIDILNGACTSVDTESFSMGPANDLSVKESHLETSDSPILGAEEAVKTKCLEITDFQKDESNESKDLQLETAELNEDDCLETNDDVDKTTMVTKESSSNKNSLCAMNVSGTNDDVDTTTMVAKESSSNKNSLCPLNVTGTNDDVDPTTMVIKESSSDKNSLCPLNVSGDSAVLESTAESPEPFIEHKQEPECESDLRLTRLKEVDESEGPPADLGSDLDVLAAAAQERQLIDVDVTTDEGKVQQDDGLKATEGRDKRKSRKQTAPRRIMYALTSMSETETDNNVDRTDEEDQQKSEKSRKQNNPKRFTNDFGDYDDNIYDNGKPKVDNLFQKEICEASESFVDNRSEETESNDSADENFYSDQYYGRENLQDSSSGMDNLQNSNAGVDFSFSNIPNLLPYMQGKNIREPGFTMAPFQNEMLATLSKSLSPSPSNTNKGKSRLGNIEENLDVVRRLREIRFYKYRKITISEKQEIAAYAKVHGVSAAAAHYGVSKSAVSMWTRTDFSDMKDDQGKRKRNCMLGNEKFEQLLERVRNEKPNKFKNLSKQDKFEVSRYAKLVGVREMARCLDIALGTVSGWMRQFPYTLKPGNTDYEEIFAHMNPDSLNESHGSPLDSSTQVKTEKSHAPNKEITCTLNNTNELQLKKSDLSAVQNKSEDDVQVKIEVEEDEAANPNQPPTWDDDTNSKDSARTLEYEEKDSDQPDEGNVGEAIDSVERNDEVDEMIAETYLAPDIDKSFEGIKEQIRGTPLENDDFFESLFRRVLSCRVAKYKTLKPSEKLEVVRYAKRNGVRRIAKLLGLATGTLSGWNTKYQNLLGLTMDGGPNFAPMSSVDGSVSTEGQSPIPVQLTDCFGNVYTPDSPGVSTTSTPANTSSSVLDNAEKSEVTAIKLLMKEQFPILLRKIEIARQVKFRNITPTEKIEIVKCAKLVGIRPTARVLGMPIGTLSGWITKYTNNLHPVYHVDNDENGESGTPAVDIKPEPELLANEMLAKNLTVMNSQAGGLLAGLNMPVNIINPAGIGLVSSLPNSFSQNFMARLNATELPTIVKKEVVDDDSDSARSSVGSDKAFGGSRIVEGFSINKGNINQGMTAVGSADFEKETQRIAEQYVQMFNEAQRLKFN